MVICLGQGADLHMAQLIPLPLTVSCSRKSRLVLVLPFWYWLTWVVLDKIQRAVKWLLLLLLTHKMASLNSRKSVANYNMNTNIQSMLNQNKNTVCTKNGATTFKGSHLLLTSSKRLNQFTWFWHSSMPFYSEHICWFYIHEIHHTKWRHLAKFNNSDFAVNKC